MIKTIYILLVSFCTANCQIIIRPLEPASTGTLSTGLIAFWNLDETSGTRYDEIGSNDLAEYGTIDYGTGLDGNAAQFTRNTKEALYCSDNADLSFDSDDSFTIAFWAKRDTNVVESFTYLGKGSGQAQSTSEYFVQARNISGSMFTYCAVSDSATTIRLTTNTTNINDTDWHFILIWYNAAIDSVRVRVDETYGTRQSFTPGLYDGFNDFQIGWKGTGQSYYFGGLIDMVGIWSRCPVISNGYAMADSIYNGGSGWKP